MAEPELMTREEVADVLRVSVRTLADLRRRHSLASYRFGRAVRFRRADVEAWVETHRVATAAPTQVRLGRPPATRTHALTTGGRAAWDWVGKTPGAEA